MVPAERIAIANQRPIRPAGDFVLLWMIAHRRPHANHALDHAIAHARELDRPLVVLEYLGLDLPHASARTHRLVIDGMVANRAAFAAGPVHYLPWVEPAPGAGAGFLRALAARACLIVADEFPTRELTRLVADLAAAAPVRVETVDANGLLPLRASAAACQRAVDFRRLVQRSLRPHLGRAPQAHPLRRLRLPRLPDGALPPGSDLAALQAGGLSRLPIDQAIGPVALRGGWRAARAALADFLDRRLVRYGVGRRSLADGAGSGLSPWLHTGHLAVHEVVQALWEREGWSPDRLAGSARGAKAGWWGMSAPAEAFLDELVTWRELGYHYGFHQADYDRFDTLPAWALTTLDRHRADRRTHLYTLAELERGATHDELWNAAQAQLRGEGIIDGYLRMLWGKKIIEWSPDPETAWAVLARLNNAWAIDGCDPNSWSGIAWCFGRFDRPWPPGRAVFGSVRWMSSENTRRKLDVKPYLARWGGA